jgi:hypothetical protein
MGDISAGHHGFGGDAAGVHAGPSEQFSFDDRDSKSRIGKTRGKRRPGLTGADDNTVKMGCHLGFLSAFDKKFECVYDAKHMELDGKQTNRSGIRKQGAAGNATLLPWQGYVGLP